MSTVPKGRADRLAFYEMHINAWIDDPEAIGINPALIASVQSDITLAREAFVQQQLAQQAAHAATFRFNGALERLSRSGAGVLKQIHGNASLHGGGIYSKAKVAPPAKKSPVGPPGKPYLLHADLSIPGALALRWKCNHPKAAQCTVYHLSRRVGVNGPLEYLGHTGERYFIDDTLPAGTSLVNYCIHAARSTSVGPAADFTVRIGGGTGVPRQQYPTSSGRRRFHTSPVGCSV